MDEMVGKAGWSERLDDRKLVAVRNAAEAKFNQKDVGFKAEMVIWAVTAVCDLEIERRTREAFALTGGTDCDDMDRWCQMVTEGTD